MQLLGCVALLGRGLLPLLLNLIRRSARNGVRHHVAEAGEQLRRLLHHPSNRGRLLGLQVVEAWRHVQERAVRQLQHAWLGCKRQQLRQLQVGGRCCVWPGRSHAACTPASGAACMHQ
jgi:hypothetical protein